MARRFAKVSEEEIVAINESDLVNTKTTIPSGSVKSGGYIPRRFASRYISTTIHLPCGEWLYNIIQLYPKGRVNGGGYIPLYCGEWLYNIIQLSPKGRVNIVRYIPRREASRYISTALHRP